MKRTPALGWLAATAFATVIGAGAAVAQSTPSDAPPPASATPSCPTEGPHAGHGEGCPGPQAGRGAGPMAGGHGGHGGQGGHGAGGGHGGHGAMHAQMMGRMHGMQGHGAGGGMHRMSGPHGSGARGDGARGERMMQRFDTDRDGQISRSEFEGAHQAAAARRMQAFEAADTDRDGKLSAAEVQAMREARRAQSGGPRGPASGAPRRPAAPSGEIQPGA